MITNLATHKAKLSDTRVTNISKDFTHKTAAITSWHRYGTKLRHCHTMSILILVQNSSKPTKKFFTFDVSTSIRGLHQKKLVLGLLLPVLGATS